MTNMQQFSWYHGHLTRNQTESVLNSRTSGTYLVRDSSSIPGDYVLSVSESAKVSHYIINNKGTVYQIGEQTFSDLPAIIEFYKKHFLDTTTLKEPVVREIANEQVRAVYDFKGKDPEDLPFKKNDILTVIKKEEENWWRARDSTGREGMIPRPYVLPHTEASPAARPTTDPSKLSTGRDSQRYSTDYNNPAVKPVVVPAQEEQSNWHYIATLDHICPYDDTRLTFRRGDWIKVLRKNDDGTWFGELNDRTGHFPFNYVQAPTSGAAWNGRDGHEYVGAIMDRCLPYDPTQLAFRKGDVIKVIRKNDDGSWFGELNDRTGHFPFNYVSALPTDGSQWNGL